MKKYWVLIFVCLVACKSKQVSQDEKWEEEKNTVRIIPTDTNYINALKLTQEAMPLFVSIFSHKDKSSKLLFALKSKFQQGEKFEHIWLLPLKYSDSSFLAVLDNTPIEINNVKLHDTFAISIKDIEDVAIYEGDSLLLGNFINNRNN